MNETRTPEGAGPPIISTTSKATRTDPLERRRQARLAPSAEQAPNEAASAVQRVLDGAFSLLSARLGLARRELGQDLTKLGQAGLGGAGGGAVLLLGVFFLDLSLLLVAAAWKGLWGAALCAGALALGHLVGGGFMLRRYARKMQESRKLAQLRAGLEEDKRWLRTLQAPSNPQDAP